MAKLASTSNSREHELLAQLMHARRSGDDLQSAELVRMLEGLGSGGPEHARRLAAMLELLGLERDAAKAYGRAAMAYNEQGRDVQARAMVQALAQLEMGSGRGEAGHSEGLSATARLAPAPSVLEFAPVSEHEVETLFGSSLLTGPELEAHRSPLAALEQPYLDDETPACEPEPPDPILVAIQATTPTRSRSKLASGAAKVQPRRSERGRAAGRARAADLRVLEGLDLFAGLPRCVLEALADRTMRRIVHADTMLIPDGAACDGWYAVVQGHILVVYEEDSELTPSTTLSVGQTFGESCLMADVAQKGNVVSSGSAELLFIDSGDLRDVVAMHTQLERVLLDRATQRLLDDLMSSSRLFRCFSASERLEISRHFEIRRADHSAPVADGQAAEPGLVIPLSGALELRSADARGSCVSRRAGPGAVLGHAELLAAKATDSQPTSILAVGDTVYAHLGQSSFLELAMTFSPFLEAVVTIDEDAA